MNKSINSFFLRIQAYIFSLLFMGEIVNILLKIPNGSLDWRSIGHQFWGFFGIIYLPLVLIILILHLIVLLVKYVPIYFFYNVWINRIFKSLKHLASSSHKVSIRKFSNWILNRYFNDYYDSLILESSSPLNTSNKYPTWLQEKSYKNKPVFIRRKHLIAKNYWPNWAFSIVILFNKLKIECYQDKNDNNNFRLEIDLRDQLYGIYNNAGKAFLSNKFLKGGEINNNNYTNRAKEIDNFLKGASPGKTLEIDAKATPLRWASGGVLPIAHWRGKYWYVLLFRGINPVGWNLANGASETKEEYENLHSLMVREFSEELILLNREPQIGDQSLVVQKTFHLSDQIFDELPKGTQDKITSKKFIKRHTDLRRNHDNLTITPETDKTKEPRLEQIKTPFEIQIRYHNKKLKEDPIKKIKDVIFSVNPFEFGIESISLYTFEMDENDYPIFGEIWEAANCLLREPVMLLSCNFIQEILEKNGGTLGEPIMESPFLDCKSLEKIPMNEYHIFDKDIEFRKRRRDQISKKRDRNYEMEVELEIHKRWLKNYENLFKGIQQEKCDIEKKKHLPTSMLCPATWRTLELIYKYNVLNKLL